MKRKVESVQTRDFASASGPLPGNEANPAERRTGRIPLVTGKDEENIIGGKKTQFTERSKLYRRGNGKKKKYLREQPAEWKRKRLESRSSQKAGKRTPDEEKDPNFRWRCERGGKKFVCRLGGSDPIAR